MTLAKIYFDCPVNLEVNYRNGDEPYLEIRRAIISRETINKLIKHIMQDDEIFLKILIKDKMLLSLKLKEKKLI